MVLWEREMTPHKSPLVLENHIATGCRETMTLPTFTGRTWCIQLTRQISDIDPTTSFTWTMLALHEGTLASYWGTATEKAEVSEQSWDLNPHISVIWLSPMVTGTTWGHTHTFFIRQNENPVQTFFHGRWAGQEAGPASRSLGPGQEARVSLTLVRGAAGLTPTIHPKEHVQVQWGRRRVPAGSWVTGAPGKDGQPRCRGSGGGSLLCESKTQRPKE